LSVFAQQVDSVFVSRIQLLKSLKKLKVIALLFSFQQRQILSSQNIFIAKDCPEKHMGANFS
jgi:hypothetical protein